MERYIHLIDDDVDFAESLKELLEIEGFGVTISFNAKDALKKQKKINAQVAIIDIRLEQQSGLDLLGDLKKVSPDILSIITSAYTDVNNTIEAIQKGAYDYLRKPIGRDELIFSLDRCFERIDLLTKKIEAEEKLRELNQELQQKVIERTAELNRTLEDLKRSNEELEQFAYVSSHDLQEPLKTIGFYLSQLEKKCNDVLDPEGKEYIHNAIDGSKRMSRLINDLLQYARLEKNSEPFKKVDTGKVLKNVLKNMTEYIQVNKANIKFNDLPDTYGDHIQLGSLFQNLISNAIKFHNGRIPDVHISSIETDKNWQFSIKDNGIGIEPGHFDSIFSLFQRVKNEEDYDGSGIGLSVCKKIVERHGGKIWVESNINEGSIFFFTLSKTGQMENLS